MKSLYIFAAVLIMMMPQQLVAQDLIGMHSLSIKEYMRHNEKKFSLNTSSSNKYYSYLKYEDRDGLRTILYFLDENDNCRYYKYIYDYALEKTVVSGLNEEYEKIGEGMWKEEIGEGMVMIRELKREDWFFSVRAKKIKE